MLKQKNGNSVADSIVGNGTADQWVRPPKNGQHLEGFSRCYLYRLIEQGLIKSISLTSPGAKKGIRLISRKSVLEYISSKESEQYSEAV